MSTTVTETSTIGSPLTKTYLGTKMIRAGRMTRLAYIKFRGWELPADENGSDEGYLVEYLDGGKPNMPGFEGYVSWSPQDVFERAYRPCDTFKERLIIEISDLKDKFEKLQAFLATSAFKSLSEVQRDLLSAQYRLQYKLIEVLELRLKEVK